jgi:uncharacterized membrane protein required for colicin V production
MTLDGYILCAFALFALLGLISGAIKQVAQWLAIAAAYIFAKPAGVALAPTLGPALGMPPALAPIGLAAGLMLLTYLFGALALRFILKKILPVQEKGRTDRLIGLALGGAKGALLGWVVLSVALAFEEPLAKAGFDLEKKTKDSHAAAFTRGHNLFDSLKMPAMESAKKFAALQGNPQALQEMLNDPKARELLDNPEIKKALNDPELRRLAQSGNPAAILQDPRVKKMLEDPEIAKKLEELQKRAQQD